MKDSSVPAAKARSMTLWAGFGCVLLALASTLPALLMEHPPADAAPAAIAAYLAKNRSGILMSTYLVGLGWGALLIAFVTGLRYVLQPFDSTGMLAQLGQLGGVALGTMLTGFAAFLGAPVVLKVTSDDPASAKALFDTACLYVNFTAFPTALSLVCFSIIQIRTGAISKAVGWLGMAVAALHLVSAAAFAPNGPMSPSGTVPSWTPLAYTLWMLVLCVALVRMKARPGSPDLAATPPRA